MALCLSALAGGVVAAPVPQVTSGVSAAELFDMAAKAADAGDMDSAETFYDALARDPDIDIRSEARYRHGLLLEGSKHYTAAAVLYRAILDERPDAGRVRLEFAKVLALMGNDAGARRALRQAQAKLQLPRDIEAWQGLQQALDKLTRAPQPTPAPVGQARQYPIDWAVVGGIPANQRVKLRTARGYIVLELKVNEAPSSVASFVTLVRQHFYDGLYFHRVVPDFVAQGGDPRGDGSGSTDYTLRSEFGDGYYQEGSVGLASAGKDTESCQFFITHTPTPHLDGRYTIFARVVSGMGVAHRLEIGDKILSVELLPVQ